MNYKAVIFDVDGTLINSAEDVHDCINIYLEKFGWKTCSVAETKAAMGGGVRHLCEELLPKDLPQEKFEEFFSEFVPYYSVHGKEKTGPFEGIPELLRDLRNAGIKLAVISSKPQEPLRMLCRHFFDGYFPVQIGDDFQRKLKPAPDTLFLAAEKLGVKPEEVLYAGDSEYDIRFAANAGVDGIGVLWGYRTREILKGAGARFLAETPEDIRKLVL